MLVTPRFKFCDAMMETVRLDAKNHYPLQAKVDSFPIA
jgi:hypothetical protein